MKDFYCQFTCICFTVTSNISICLCQEKNNVGLANQKEYFLWLFIFIN